MSVAAPKGLWNIVLSGYPKAGKTLLARRLVTQYPCFARVGVDDLRAMLFNESPPCRDEFMVYSLIAEVRDALLRKEYSVVIDSTAPDNVTRSYLLATKIRNVNHLVILFNVEKEVIIERNIEMFGDASSVFAWDGRWETPQRGIPIFKFKSNNLEEFEAYYASLKELLESEMHPFKPEFQRPFLPLKDIRRRLRSFLGKKSE
jgi:predicted kinase